MNLTIKTFSYLYLIIHEQLILQYNQLKGFWSYVSGLHIMHPEWKCCRKSSFWENAISKFWQSFFSQLFPQKTCFSYVVHGAILTSWPHGLAKVISDCPALQIAPAGLPAVTLRFQRLDNPPLSMRCYQLVSTSVWWTDLKSCCFCFVFCFKKLLYNFKIILIKW